MNCWQMNNENNLGVAALLCDLLVLIIPLLVSFGSGPCFMMNQSSSIQNLVIASTQTCTGQLSVFVFSPVCLTCSDHCS